MVLLKRKGEGKKVTAAIKKQDRDIGFIFWGEPSLCYLVLRSSFSVTEINICLASGESFLVVLRILFQLTFRLGSHEESSRLLLIGCLVGVPPPQVFSLFCDILWHPEW